MPPSPGRSKELFFPPRSGRPPPCMLAGDAACSAPVVLMAAARQTAVAVVLILLGLVLPLASGGTVIALLLLALLTIWPVTVLGRLDVTPRLLFAGLGLMAVWAVASAFWSPLHDPAKALRTVALFVPGLVLLAWMIGPRKEGSTGRQAILAVVGVALAVFLFEGLSDAWLLRLLRGDPVEQAGFDLERVGRGVALFAPLLWPAAAALWSRHRLGAAALLIVGIVTVFILPMNAAILGIVLGALAFAATLATPRAVVAVLALLFILYTGVAPWLSRDVVTLASVEQAGIDLPSPQAHRIGIWNFAADRALQHAPLGAGFDAARVIGSEGVRLEEMRPRFGIAPAALPLHPHNAVLQTWLELGVIGVVALVLIYGGILQVLWRLRADRRRMAAATAAFVTVLPPFVLNFGMWQAWWIAGLCLVAALAAGLLRPSHAESP